MIYKEKEIKFREFFKFLHEHNCYQEFQYNFHHFNVNTPLASPKWKNHRIQVFYDNCQYNIYTYINYAFIWSQTKQEQLWEDLAKLRTNNGERINTNVLKN